MTIFAIDKYSSGDSNKQMGEMGDIHAIVSPISIPITSEKMLSLHIKKNALLVHVATEMPLAFDEEGVLEFLQPLFNMQRLGSKNNVLITFSKETNTTADALLAWQLFGGIAIPIFGDIPNTLKVLDNMISLPLNGIDGNKRAVQLATNIPFPQLDAVDELGIERSLIYAMVHGELPWSESEGLFELSQKDRDVLWEKML